MSDENNAVDEKKDNEAGLGVRPHGGGGGGGGGWHGGGGWRRGGGRFHRFRGGWGGHGWGYPGWAWWGPSIYVNEGCTWAISSVTPLDVVHVLQRVTPSIATDGSRWRQAYVDGAWWGAHSSGDALDASSVYYICD